MELLTQTNFQKHLYFENNPKSKEFKLDKCIKVLAMIAQLKDRNQTIFNMCDNFYGRSENGKVKAPEREAIKFNRNLEVIERLKKYYNYCLSNVGVFPQHSS